VIDARYRELLARHLEAENDHRLEETLATLTPDCVFDDRGLGQVFHGREAAGRHYRMWWDGFDTTVHTERRHFPSPTLAVVETQFRGTHNGTFLGLAATGREVAIPLAIFIDLRDGLLAGERFYWDRTGLLAQLGADRFPGTIEDGSAASPSRSR